MTTQENCDRHKLEYKTERKAWLRAFKLYLKHGLDLSPWKCGWCGQWHLTKQVKPIPEDIVEELKRKYPELFF